jgi:hypothetical protein
MIESEFLIVERISDPFCDHITHVFKDIIYKYSFDKVLEILDSFYCDAPGDSCKVKDSLYEWGIVNPSNDPDCLWNCKEEDKHLQIIKKLVEKHDYMDYYVKEMMIYSAKFGHLKIIIYLISLINARYTLKDDLFGNDDFESTLGMACRYGHLEIIKYFHKHSIVPFANSDLRFTFASFPIKDKLRDIFYVALKYGHLNIIEYFFDVIDEKSKLNLMISLYSNCLDNANALDIVKFLCCRKCPCKYDDIYAAALCKKWDIVKYLYEQFENVVNLGVLDLIYLVIKGGNMELVEFFYNKKHTFDDTCIILAARHGHFEIFKYIQSVHFSTIYYDALNEASKYGFLEIVKHICQESKINCTEETLKLAQESENTELIYYVEKQVDFYYKAFNGIVRRKYDINDELVINDLSTADTFIEITEMKSLRSVTFAVHFDFLKEIFPKLEKWSVNKISLPCLKYAMETFLVVYGNNFQYESYIPVWINLEKLNILHYCEDTLYSEYFKENIINWNTNFIESKFLGYLSTSGIILFIELFEPSSTKVDLCRLFWKYVTQRLEYGFKEDKEWNKIGLELFKSFVDKCNDKPTSKVLKLLMEFPITSRFTTSVELFSLFENN